MNVYALHADADRYQMLGMVDEDDLDLLIDGFRAAPMAEDWTPLAVKAIVSVPQIPEMYEFVTDPFVERVHERGLEGFLFRPVWKAPDG